MEKSAKKALKTNQKLTTEGPEMLIEIRKDKRLECQNEFLQYQKKQFGSKLSQIYLRIEIC